MFKRIVTTVIGLPILFIILHLGNPYLLPALLIVSLLGLRELYQVSLKAGMNPISWAGYLTAVIYFYFLYSHSRIPNGVTLTVLMIIVLMSLPIVSRKNYTIHDICFTLFGIVYVPFMMSHLIAIDQMMTPYLIWMVFVVAWCCDTFAYLTGLLIGKHKLCPSISPKKTIEGAIGGIIGSVAGCFAFSWFLMPEYLFPLSMMGLGGAIISQLGDLSASSIKRYFDIKDFGNLFPGHGGILDRFDSILFTAPYVFYYLVWVIQLR